MTPTDPRVERLMSLIDSYGKEAHGGVRRDFIVAALSEALGDSQPVAPWLDHSGQTIRHGDRLLHPFDGIGFTAVRLNGYQDEGDAWRAIYDDATVSRLCLQIGDKGRAVLALPQRAEPASVQAQWIPRSERLPPSHEDFIALNSDGRVFRSRMCYGMHEPWFTYPKGDRDASDTMPAWVDVVAWMPLPTLAAHPG